MYEQNPLQIELQYILLTMVKRACDSKKKANSIHFLQTLGLDDSEIDMFSSLTPNSYSKLAELKPFDVSVNTHELSHLIKVDKQALAEERETLRLIELGLSRKNIESLYKCLGRVLVNTKSFQKFRRDLGIDDSSRFKPSKLSDDQIQELDERFSNLNNFEKHRQKLFSDAVFLIRLAEITAIDINQIYSYYYIPNKDIFDKRKALAWFDKG